MKTILKTRKLWVVVENGVLVVVSTDVNTPAMTKNQEDLVMKDIKAQEKRLSIREERINEDAFYGGKLGSKGGNKQGNKRHEKTKRWCGVCKRDNHNEVDCWRRKNGGVPQMSAKNERKCYVCDKPGHIAKDCRLRKAERVNLSLEETDEEVVNEGHILFSAVEEESSSNVNDETRKREHPSDDKPRRADHRRGVFSAGISEKLVECFSNGIKGIRSLI